jgi:hypothetical protein
VSRLYNPSTANPIDRLKSMIDRAGADVPLEEIVAHHTMAAVMYKVAARTFARHARQAYTYANLEKHTARDALARASVVLTSATAREARRFYRPLDPDTVLEAEVLLALNKPEPSAPVGEWLRYYYRSANYYSMVANVAVREQFQADKRYRAAMSQVERYRKLIGGDG